MAALPEPQQGTERICFYSNSKCHNLSNKTSCFFSENPDTPGSWHQNYFFQTICDFDPYIIINAPDAQIFKSIKFQPSFCHPAAVPCCGSGKAAICISNLGDGSLASWFSQEIMPLGTSMGSPLGLVWQTPCRRFKEIKKHISTQRHCICILGCPIFHQISPTLLDRRYVDIQGISMGKPSFQSFPMP